MAGHPDRGLSGDVPIPMKILMVPGNNHNAKSYPHWDEIIRSLSGHEIKKIEGLLKEQELIDLVNWCDVWVSIDSFLPHLAAYHHLKRGIVLWGKSDPLIFGYKHNVNLLGGRSYLRAEQFRWWMDEPIDPNVFVGPEVVVKEILGTKP
jgi:hypothetical protein